MFKKTFSAAKGRTKQEKARKYCVFVSRKDSYLGGPLLASITSGVPSMAGSI